jgi:hypothetical protein
LCFARPFPSDFGVPDRASVLFFLFFEQKANLFGYRNKNFKKEIHENFDENHHENLGNELDFRGAFRTMRPPSFRPPASGFYPVFGKSALIGLDIEHAFPYQSSIPRSTPSLFLSPTWIILTRQPNSHLSFIVPMTVFHAASCCKSLHVGFAFRLSFVLSQAPYCFSSLPDLCREVVHELSLPRMETAQSGPVLNDRR